MIKVLVEGASGRARGVILVAAALILGGCVGGSEDRASNLSTTSTTEAAIGAGDTSAPATTTMSEEADTSEVTMPPSLTTSLPAVSPSDVPPLDLEVMTGDEVAGPETGVWADYVPAEFRPCENTGPETEAAVIVWTVVRRGEAIGYLVGPVTDEDRASLVRRTYAACAGGGDDIAGDPAVRSWSTGCEAGSRVLGRWRDALADGETVFVAAIRTGC